MEMLTRVSSREQARKLDFKGCEKDDCPGDIDMRVVDLVVIFKRNHLGRWVLPRGEKRTEFWNFPVLKGWRENEEPAKEV